MIQSMTAFARAEARGKWGSAIIELRSINHRYLEFSVRLPDSLGCLEGPLREKARHQLSRGKIECTLRYQSGENAVNEITINQSLMEQVCRLNHEVALQLKNPFTHTIDILKWPGVLQLSDVPMEEVQEAILEMLDRALKNLMDARKREGEELKQLFYQRLESMKQEIGKIREHLPAIIKEQRERLIKRFSDIKMELDPQRLEQEMVLFAQKIDVSEELDRLDAHISEVRHALKQGGVLGRRLDFLMQELNREANTLGSKSVNLETTRASVELKVLIEQMREQVQNVE